MPTSSAPGITLAAQLDIVAASAANGHRLECAYAATYDHETRQITGARLLNRGTSKKVIACLAQVRFGEVHVHTHPGYGPVEPSDTDISLTAAARAAGIGLAITNPSATDLVMILEPPAGPAPHPRKTQLWSLGPFALLYYPKEG